MSWVAQEGNLDPGAYLGWEMTLGCLAVMKAEGEIDEGGLHWFDTKMTADSSCEALFQSLTGTRWLSHSSQSHLYVNPHDNFSSLAAKGCVWWQKDKKIRVRKAVENRHYAQFGGRGGYCWNINHVRWEGRRLKVRDQQNTWRGKKWWI